MIKRLRILGAVMIIMAGVLLGRILMIISDAQYTQVALTQSRYRVEVVSTRGRIYDCNMRTMAGGRTQYRAAIAPSEMTREYLRENMASEEYEQIAANMQRNSPFVAIVKDGSLDGNGVTVFKTETRYSANTVAEHTIGYLGGSGEGVTGIERAYDDYLSSVQGAITATYMVTAAGEGLAGIEPEIVDTTANSQAGVVLTLDIDIQQLAERAAEEYLKKGTVIVMEIPSGELRAVVSMPSIECDSIGEYLESEDSPLVNRALSAYDVGSVFKLVTAQAALESGITPDLAYCCEGSVQIGENTFHCSNREGHGELDMYGAIAQSCNTYFIELARQVGAERVLECARVMGLGKEIELCEDYCTAAGCLPTEQELKKPAALANFAFGQGQLMATPMHMAVVTATIANGGVLTQPQLVKGLINAKGEYIKKTEAKEGERVLSKETCEVLTLAMRMAVTEGTAQRGEGERVQVAAKTGTAQTGITENGRSVLQAWYAGFFPYDEPRYVCIVLAEDGVSGGASAGPVFKVIADGIR